MFGQLRIEEFGAMRLVIGIFHDGWSKEDDKIGLLTILAFLAEGPAEPGEIAEERHFGVTLLRGIAHETAHNQGVAARDDDLSFDSAAREDVGFIDLALNDLARRFWQYL